MSSVTKSAARWPRAWTVALAWVVLPACWGSTAERRLSNRVEPRLVRVLPPDGQRQVYEAENEVVIALDRLDRTRDLVARYNLDLETFEERLEKARENNSPGMPVNEARRAWLESRVELAEAEVRSAEVSVLCARTEFELAKARLAVRFALPVPQDFVSPFEVQARSCAEEQARVKADAEAESPEARERRERWHASWKKQAGEAGDYNHGLWIE